MKLSEIAKFLSEKTHRDLNTTKNRLRNPNVKNLLSGTKGRTPTSPSTYSPGDLMKCAVILNLIDLGFDEEIYGFIVRKFPQEDFSRLEREVFTYSREIVLRVVFVGDKSNGERQAKCRIVSADDCAVAELPPGKQIYGTLDINLHHSVGGHL